MIDYEKTLLDLIMPIVEDKKNLEIRKMPSLSEDEIVLHVYAGNDDVARLIGKKGSMASALRQVVSVGARLNNKRVNIKFESI
ncbi:MAG: KH domain-containing protein [Anaerorhabdus sp.]